MRQSCAMEVCGIRKVHAAVSPHTYYLPLQTAIVAYMLEHLLWSTLTFYCLDELV